MKENKHKQLNIRILPIAIIICILLIIVIIVLNKNKRKTDNTENFVAEVETNQSKTTENTVINDNNINNILNEINSNASDVTSENVWEKNDDSDASRILSEVRELLKKKEVDSSKTVNEEAVTVTTTDRSEIIQSDIEGIEAIIQDLESNPDSGDTTASGVTISMHMDLNNLTGLSKEQFKQLIGNCKYDTTKFFYDNSDLIYDVCQKYHINEVFFVGLISAESAWDVRESHRVKHNYISIKGSSHDMYTFSSIEEGMEVAAALLHRNYLTPRRKLL